MSYSTPAPLPPPLSETCKHLAFVWDDDVERLMEMSAADCPDCLRRRIAALEDENSRLRAALAGWKCKGCNGTGRAGHSLEDKWNGVVVACRACAGSGLHPAARAALGDDAPAGGGTGTGGAS